MFDWADVMTYLLIVLKKKDAQELEKKSKEELSDEFRSLLRLALQCQPIPVKLASGEKTLCVLNVKCRRWLLLKL